MKTAIFASLAGVALVVSGGAYYAAVRSTTVPTAEILGSWATQEKASILTVYEEDDALLVEETYLRGYDAVHDVFEASFKGGTLTLDAAGREITFRFDDGVLKRAEDVYLPVPDGWSWRDGWDGLEGYKHP